MLFVSFVVQAGDMNMAEQFDVVVIGGGPGGYIAAIRAAQLGFKTACIDDWSRTDGKPAPGGTCTNVGCIPSKALLQSSENFEHAGHAFADHGIGVSGLTIDVKKMLARKDKVVAQNNDGILYLFKKNKITFFHGMGSFAGKEGDLWKLRSPAPSRPSSSAKHVIIATGSKPRALPGVAFDNVRVLDNEGALAIPDVPQQARRRRRRRHRPRDGQRLAPARRRSDGARSAAGVPRRRRHGRRQGSVEALHEAGARHPHRRADHRCEGRQERRHGDATRTRPARRRRATFDRLIVSIGRVPFTGGLGADAVGLQLDERGFVAVDADCRTNLPNVWAIGDVVRGPMLAHKAEEEGVAVAERIAGQHGHVDFNTVPWVIYTAPEIAWVGKTEQQLKAEGVDYRAGSFPFTANGRARAMGDTAGFVKILADRKTDRILGMHVIGPMASELISEGVVAMEFGAASEDLARICHAHPTLSEATKEAALAVDGRTLNL